jgi:hypothetical protein
MWTRNVYSNSLLCTRQWSSCLTEYRGFLDHPHSGSKKKIAQNLEPQPLVLILVWHVVCSFTCSGTRHVFGCIRSKILPREWYRMIVTAQAASGWHASHTEFQQPLTVLCSGIAHSTRLGLFQQQQQQKRRQRRRRRRQWRRQQKQQQQQHDDNRDKLHTILQRCIYCRVIRVAVG